MRKKIWVLSLLVLLVNTLIIPVSNVSYANTTNWITENDDWSRTLKYNNIEITVAGSNLNWPSNWRYYWWSNINATNIWEEYNNNWWWAEDSEENWYNAWWNENRRWPCPEWWHVPSKWEWYDLSISWCKLDETCNEHLNQVNWNIYAVQRYPDWLNFWTTFWLNLNDWGYWTSTPSWTEQAYNFSFDGWTVSSLVPSPRNYRYYVRCFKNPKTIFSLTFKNKSDETIIWDAIEDIENWTTITEEMIPEQVTWYTNHYYLTWDEWTEIDNVLGYEITKDTEIYVESVPNEDTPYKAEHYKENLEWEFEFIETWDYVWTTDTLVTWEYNIYEWFTWLEIEAKNLSWDWSTVVIINYLRKSHNLTIDWNTTETKYWTEIILNEWTREWYHFVEWQWLPTISWDEKYYMPDEDVIITWVWEQTTIETPVVTPSAWWGSSISTPTKQETKAEQEHNSADTKKETTESTKEENITVNNEQTITANTDKSEAKTIEEKIEIIKPKALTRWELAVFSNILTEVFPQLTENKENVNEVCNEYTDRYDFSINEEKAVSKLCRLAIIGINEDDHTPLETFGINDISNNDEFIKVVNRMTDKYSEKELKDLKSALSILEGTKEDNLVFGTVYDIFMKVKALFN